MAPDREYQLRTLTSLLRLREEVFPVTALHLSFCEGRHVIRFE